MGEVWLGKDWVLVYLDQEGFFYYQIFGYYVLELVVVIVVLVVVYYEVVVFGYLLFFLGVFWDYCFVVVWIDLFFLLD